MQRVFLITDLSRSGAQSSLEAIGEFFDVEVVPPVFLPIESLDDPTIVDQAAFVARNTRPAMLGEVGCALAHRSVYEKIIEQHLSWALVLEDDVTLPSIARLASRVDQVVDACSQTEPVVFSFSSGHLPLSRLIRQGPLRGSIHPGIQPYSTECYLVNAKAARLMLTLQTPITSTADWPSHPSQVTFFVDTGEFVGPSNSSSSQIDPEALRQRSSNRTRIELWSTVWYWKHRPYFRSLADYAITVLKPRAYVRLYGMLQHLWPVRRDPVR